MGDNENRKRFESLALPHLDAACNLARRLTRKDDAVATTWKRSSPSLASARGSRP
jgi:hypothetical protein